MRKSDKIKLLFNFRCNIPERESEHYRVERFTVETEEAKFFNLRQAISMGGIAAHRTIEPGTYTKLLKKGEHYPLMSDTPAEIRDHFEFIRHAEGTVLVNGLGLGWCIDAALFRTTCQPLPWYYLSSRERKNIVRRKSKWLVNSLTVIEIDPELIALVGSYYLEKYPTRLTIICADALKYKPPKGVQYNAVWHDIWPTIDYENLEQMKKLHYKYGHCADWQGSWAREECKRWR